MATISPDDGALPQGDGETYVPVTAPRLLSGTTYYHGTSEPADATVTAGTTMLWLDTSTSTYQPVLCFKTKEADDTIVTGVLNLEVAKREQSFTVELGNNAGTLRHRISNGAFTNAHPRLAFKVTGAVRDYNNTPSVDASTDFTAGLGIEAAATQSLILNTAAKPLGSDSEDSAISLVEFSATIVYNTTGTDLYVTPRIRETDVNGTTLKRAALTFTSSAGNFALTTGNIAAGKAIVVHLRGPIA